LNRLKVCNHVPPDVTAIIIDVMITASTPKFCETFTSLRALMIIQSEQMAWEKIFEIAENLYKSCLTERIWCASQKRPKQSGFGADTNPNKNVICHNCGNKGHYAPECPDRGGGGGGGGPSPRKPNNKRTPPQEGQPETRSTSFKNAEGASVMEYWCKICRCWNRSHVSENHERGKRTVPTGNTGAPTANTGASTGNTGASTGNTGAPAVHFADGSVTAASVSTPPVIASVGGVATHAAAANLQQLLGNAKRTE
jgi:hypothetical protein